MAESGERGSVLWEGLGRPAPSPPARESGGRCKLPQRGSGRSPGRAFSCIFNTQDDLSGQQNYGPLAKRVVGP